MVRRHTSELTSPIYGFFSYTTEPNITLTDDCADLAKLIGCTAEELAGRPLADFISCFDRDSGIAALQEQLAQYGETELLISFTKKDGTCICVLNRGRPEEDRFGNEYVRNVFLTAPKTGQLLTNLKDTADMYRAQLTQHEKRIDFLQTYAEQDSLTGIFNAGTTRKLTEEYITQYRGGCAMLIIDIDDFKHVNDRYGHLNGDILLVTAANAIKKLFRSNDIIGRIGGDEFFVLMKDVSDRHIISLRCSQIIAAFNEMHIEGMAEQEYVGCSVGAAVSPVGQTCYDALFQCADNAMYRAKRAGGNRYEVDVCTVNG